MSAVVRLANRAERTLSQMFPGYFSGAKHNHYRDFGFPETLTFDALYRMYQRNGVAAAGVDKTAFKTWQDTPYLLEQERDGSETGEADETSLERDLRKRFAAIRLWTRLAAADRMAMVGGYAGVILRLKDNQAFDQPVGRVPGGLDGLHSIEPVWAGQLTVAEYDTNQNSETYGEVKAYQFTESAVAGNASQAKRQFKVHPDRVIIWSEDGTINGSSILEPGFNDLMTMEKVSGAGGEGFWKNAKSAPVLQVEPDLDLLGAARADGQDEKAFATKLNEQVAKWQEGFDQLLMIQGMKATTLSVTLPSPEHFFGIALQAFAASINMPVKILVGMQTGERASQEDAQEWAQTCMSRRSNIVTPNVMELVSRLVRFGILPENDWFIDQADLTESSMSEKIDRAGKMAETNAKMQSSGEWIFTPEEIRAAVGYEPLSDADKMRDDTSEEDANAALTPPAADPAVE